MALCCRTQTHTLHTPLRLTLLPLTLVFQVPAGNASANDGAANPAPSSDGRCVLQDSRPSLCVNKDLAGDADRRHRVPPSLPPISRPPSPHAASTASTMQESPVSLVCRYCRRLIGSGRETVVEACLW